MAKDVDDYIQGAPSAQRAVLRQLRELVLSAAPGVTEKVSYGMPTYVLGGQRLLHFASATKHVGVYGLVHVDGEVAAELRGFMDHRSTLKLPVDQPLPMDALRTAIRRKVRVLETTSAKSNGGQIR